MTRRQRLRQLVNGKPGLVVPGASDGVSAKLVPFAEFNELIGVTEQFGLGERHAS